jgi:hypothetical protein
VTSRAEAAARWLRMLATWHQYHIRARCFDVKVWFKDSSRSPAIASKSSGGSSQRRVHRPGEEESPRYSLMARSRVPTPPAISRSDS